MVYEWRNGSIFQHCRVGNLEAVKDILKQGIVDVNEEDQWNGTPLYYACLCGHLEVVKYLLLWANAVCDEKTFLGERCIYGALTDEIRNFLRSEKVVELITITRSPYYKFCEKLMNLSEFSDICFIDESGKSVTKLHKFVLFARNTKIKDILNDVSESGNDEVLIYRLWNSPEILSLFFDYLYTGRTVVSKSQLNDLHKLACFYQCDDLIDQCQSQFSQPAKRRTKVRNSGYQYQDNENKQLALQAQKGVEILQSSMRALGQLGIPEALWYEPVDNWKFFAPTLGNALFDFCLRAQGATKFYCHKVVLCARSEYFAAKLFRYAQDLSVDENGIPVLNLMEISAEALAALIYYAYGEEITNFVSIEVAFECLNLSSLFLLPSLMQTCSVYISNNLSFECVMDALNAARLYDLPRLDDSCVQFIAKNLDEMLANQVFRGFVQADAESIKDRESSDSIIIIDDVTFYLRNLPDYEQNQEKVRRLLDELNFGIYNRK